MLAKVVVLFLIGMAVLALWGRFATQRRIGRYCAHCGKPHPCGCPKAKA
ncbi:MAG: hypothetical protein R3D56_01720 [Paracoccaceae bacterium]